MIQQLPPKACHDLREADPSIVLLDVRTPEEFAAGHPTGALNVPIMFFGPRGPQPNPEFLGVVAKVAPDKAKRLVLSCKSGGRSQRAAELLEQAGWQNLVNNAAGWGGGVDPETGRPLTGWADSRLPSSNETGDAAWEKVRTR